jgi:DNA invertase Pin-like site-specific DNA recombinase
MIPQWLQHNRNTTSEQQPKPQNHHTQPQPQPEPQHPTTPHTTYSEYHDEPETPPVVFKFDQPLHTITAADIESNLIATVKTIVESQDTHVPPCNIPMPESPTILHIPTKHKPGTTPAVIYLRVSNKPELAKDKSSSLQVQLQSCLQYAKQHYLQPHTIAVEPNTSGASTKRPRLFDAIQALRKEHIMIVHRLDRISRDLLLFTTIQKEIHNQGAKLKSTQGEGTIDDTPQSKLIREILTSIANYERAIISQRTAAAMRHKAQKRQRNSSLPPWGWLYDPQGNMIPDPQKAHILLWIAQNRHLPLNKIYEYTHLNTPPGLRSKLYRATLNRVIRKIKADQHPIPTPEEISRVQEIL